MEKATETTFKDLQMDERYKRLERTLKMVLLKNAELNNGNASAWPSISSINGDHLDTSCAAMSVQSSRLGSEIVSSSMNLRNIVTHKKSSFAPRHAMATSSENQFPIKKDHDSVMMPPPKFPGPSSARSRQLTADNKRTPLLNMSINLERRDNDYLQSAPTVSGSSISQCPASADQNSVARYGENADFLRRNVYDESDGGSQVVKVPERVFSRWRVLLNDKAQLIIKGTLECGKVARSKPVIRRLAATSVQSVFKHTYHLRGNLVDERHELPEYVSGKFYNGFPDDWENVYQVWRNFVSDGSRLSFRWPTPITDSDDDIKSEITEVSYHPRANAKLNKSKSPRKRTRWANSAIFSSAKKADNRSEMNSSCRSQLTAGISNENSVKSSNSLQGNESIVENARIERNESLNSTSNRGSDGNQRVVANSLKDIIQEDKLNIIIDNLTNKNCSLEYIKKIVEMFDCMKYVVSYQSTASSDAERHSENVDKSPGSERMKKHYIEETKNDRTPRCSVDPFEGQSAERSSVERNSPRKLPRDRSSTGDARRKLTEDDWDSGESENDIFDKQRRSSAQSVRTKQRHGDRERSRLSSRQFERSSEKRTRRVKRDSSLSDEEFPPAARTTGNESRDRVRVYSRRSQIAENDHRESLDRYDSSISLTEDESARDCKKEITKARAETYDSSVSITEDERGDARIDRRIVHPNVIKSNDLPDGRKGFSKCYDRSNCSSNDSGIVRNADQRPIKTCNVVKSTSNVKENVRTTGEHIDGSRENREDSAYVSLDVKRQRDRGAIRAVVEPETDNSYYDGRPREMDYKRDFQGRSPSPSKPKIQQTRKPVVIADEPTSIDLQRFHRPKTKNDDDSVDSGKPNEMKTAQKEAAKMSSDAAADCPKVGELDGGKSRKKGTSRYVEDRNDTRGMGEASLDRDEIDLTDKSVDAKFGSETNPKKLTGWVPAVICEDDDSKCHLVFQGKLINEAGHVANRKFTTDFLLRRLSPKLIETVDNVFYQLVGDLSDTKHVVPLSLVKLCHGGCPSKISHFCQKWKALSSSENNETLMSSRSHNTSVDCLSVRTSSRGRRILPPLNYWTGERVTTKGDQAVYSPGNCHESSIPSSLEKSNEDKVSERKSPRTRTRRVLNYETGDKRTDASRTNRARKQDAEKPLSPSTSKSPTKNSPKSQGSQRLRNGKRRLPRKMHGSSSESDEEETKTKVLLRKRKPRASDATSSVKSSSDRKLRNVSKNTVSSQSLEQSTSAHSFEKPVESEGKSKLRKRQKMNQEEAQTAIAATSKQFTTPRGSSAITCTLYKNVPLHDGDLSEDQLSTI